MRYHTIYVDMDGVLADYYAYVKPLQQTTFREKVLTLKVFEELAPMKLMPNLIAMLNDYVYEWPDAKVEILSSGGSYKKDIFEAACAQKKVWLEHHGIKWKANFTHCGESKAQFADRHVLLIDDNDINCKNFRWNDGEALRWMGDMQSARELSELLED